MEEIVLSCPACDADCIIKHELNRPYKVGFCPLCGEEVTEDIEWGDQYSEYDEGDEYEE